jgi:hypothetical protein
MLFHSMSLTLQGEWSPDLSGDKRIEGAAFWLKQYTLVVCGPNGTDAIDRKGDFIGTVELDEGWRGITAIMAITELNPNPLIGLPSGKVLPMVTVAMTPSQPAKATQLSNSSSKCADAHNNSTSNE